MTAPETQLENAQEQYKAEDRDKESLVGLESKGAKGNSEWIKPARNVNANKSQDNNT